MPFTPLKQQPVAQPQTPKPGGSPPFIPLGMTYKGFQLKSPEAQGEMSGESSSASTAASEATKKRFGITSGQEIVQGIKSIPDVYSSSAEDLITALGSPENASTYVKLSTDLETLKDKASVKNALVDGTNLIMDIATKVPSTEKPFGSFLLSAKNELKEQARLLPEKRGFENATNLMRSLLTRASGQVGMLTQQDVEAVLPSFLDLGSAYSKERDIAKSNLAAFFKGKFGEASVPVTLKPYLKSSQEIPFKNQGQEEQQLQQLIQSLVGSQ